MGVPKLICYVYLAIGLPWLSCGLVTNSAMSQKSLSVGQNAHSGSSMVEWGDRAMTVQGTRYLVSSNPKGVLTFSGKDGHLVTVIEQQSGHESTVEAIRNTIVEFSKIDDVWQPAFLNGVILLNSQHSDTPIVVDIEVQQHLESLGNSWITILTVDEASSETQPGPYIILDGRLHDVFKLVDDDHGTFMTAVRPPISDTFEPLRLKSSTDDFAAVALPSRIKSRSCSSKPFCGFRIAVKDNLYLKGVKTSLQCRAYYMTYGPNTETARCVKKLEDGGAHILGTLRMNPFGHWVEPVEYIDYQAPWNPRADRYQSAGGSSTGPASALAAYEWLDFTIGTDTWGSIMRPALWCGLFGLRPTIGTVSRDGLKRGITFMDTPGVYGRDLGKLIPFVNSWLDHDYLQSSPKPFTSLIWPTDMWESVDQNQRDLAKPFFELLKTSLGLDSTEISFAQKWAQDPPKEALGKSFDEYMVKATANLAQQPAKAAQQWAREYYDKFGTNPYTSPPVRRNLDNLSNVTDHDFEEALKHMKVYQSWFHTKIWQSETSHPLIMLPIENMTPRYRDEFPNFRRPPAGINTLFLAPVLGAPELLVPIDEIPYMSKVTGQQEKLPFVIGLMALPGTELMLMERIHQLLLKSSKYHAKVSTGKNMFSGSES